MKRLLAVILSALMLLSLFAGCDGLGKTKFTVTFYDSDGKTVLAEVPTVEGKAVELPELTRDGYSVFGYYATPALLIPYDVTAPVTEETAVFVAWRSTVVDERPWMIAGSLAAHPENNWGKVWPQDDFLFQPVEGEFNTFTYEISLFAGDQFKIAVVDEEAVWGDNLGAGCVVANEYVEGGEDAYNTGANIDVLQDGLYRLTFVTDAETLSLCKLSIERIGDAESVTVKEYKFQVQGNFNEWGKDDTQFLMSRNGDDAIWYYLLTVTKDDYDTANGSDFAMFGVKELVSGNWYDMRNVDESAEPNFKVTAGTYLVYLALDLSQAVPAVTSFIVDEPHYYVVGTCGKAGWAADANAENTAYQMTEKSNGTYELTTTFLDTETADWADGKVAFKVAYGCQGVVPNDLWYGTADGGNISVEPGKYTIVFDPATGKVTY